MRTTALIAAAIATVALAAPSAATAAPPTIENQWVSDITSTDATLNATINPNGLLTKYKLQIDTTGNFDFFQTDGCPLHPPGIVCTAAIVPGEPLPPGLIEPPESSLPAAYGGQHVSVNLASIGATLQPDTTYHFRAIAANGFPIVEGPDLTFTTLVAEEEEPAEEEPGAGEGPPTEEADAGDSVSATPLLPAGNLQSTSPPLEQPSIAMEPIKGRSQGSGRCKSARRHKRRMPHRPAVRRACIPVPHARVSRSRLP